MPSNSKYEIRWSTRKYANDGQPPKKKAREVNSVEATGVMPLIFWRRHEPRPSTTLTRHLCDETRLAEVHILAGEWKIYYGRAQAEVTDFNEKGAPTHIPLLSRTIYIAPNAVDSQACWTSSSDITIADASLRFGKPYERHATYLETSFVSAMVCAWTFTEEYRTTALQGRFDSTITEICPRNTGIADILFPGCIGPEYDKEELAKWHRTELEKEEVREQMQRRTRPRPTLLRNGTRKRRAASKIPAESVELRPTDDSEEYQPPAKCTHRKLRDVSNANVTDILPFAFVLKRLQEMLERMRL
ncbi:hypothetical protein EDD85DRAFT_942917 [Armillaria nabsnona]|nr:hypothetical protein EDD85DRAFT_942917 [Armillaria nabsnona]